MKATGRKAGYAKTFSWPLPRFRLSRRIQASQLASAPEHCQKHGPGQLAGIRVLKRRMIAGHYGQAAGQCEFGAVSKREPRAREENSPPLRPRQEAVKRDPSQAHDHAQVSEQAYL